MGKMKTTQHDVHAHMNKIHQAVRGQTPAKRRKPPMAPPPMMGPPMAPQGMQPPGGMPMGGMPDYQ